MQGRPQQAVQIGHRLRPGWVIGVSALGVWLLWNAFWLADGRLPPSLLTLIHLPAPTTGMTRAIHALLAGDGLESLWWNPLWPIYIGLMATSLVVLATSAVRRQAVRLPSMLVAAWLVSLSVGWIVKLAMGPATW